MDYVKELLETKEAAPVVGVSPYTLEKWRVTGGGPRYRKVGRLVRYARADLDAFLAAAARNSTSDKAAA